MDCALEIINELQQRRLKGLETYGVVVDPLAPATDWVQHLLEEMLDAAVYSKAIKERILWLESELKRLTAENRELRQQLLAEDRDQQRWSERLLGGDK